MTVARRLELLRKTFALTPAPFISDVINLLLTVGHTRDWGERKRNKYANFMI